MAALQNGTAFILVAAPSLMMAVGPAERLEQGFLVCRGSPAVELDSKDSCRRALIQQKDAANCSCEIRQNHWASVYYKLLPFLFGIVGYFGFSRRSSHVVRLVLLNLALAIGGVVTHIYLWRTSPGGRVTIFAGLSVYVTLVGVVKANASFLILEMICNFRWR